MIKCLETQMMGSNIEMQLLFLIFFFSFTIMCRMICCEKTSYFCFKDKALNDSGFWLINFTVLKCKLWWYCVFLLKALNWMQWVVSARMDLNFLWYYNRSLVLYIMCYWNKNVVAFSDQHLWTHFGPWKSISSILHVNNGELLVIIQ